MNARSRGDEKVVTVATRPGGEGGRGGEGGGRGVSSVGVAGMRASGRAVTEKINKTTAFGPYAARTSLFPPPPSSSSYLTPSPSLPLPHPTLHSPSSPHLPTPLLPTSTTSLPRAIPYQWLAYLITGAIFLHIAGSNSHLGDLLSRAKLKSGFHTIN